MLIFYYRLKVDYQEMALDGANESKIWRASDSNIGFM